MSEYARAYDAGKHFFVKQIAGSLRVLFQNSPTSLIRHLDAEGVRLRSVMSELREGQQPSPTFMYRIGMRAGPTGPTVPKLGNWGVKWLATDEWWRETIAVLDPGRIKMTRESVVRNVADKDGVAHVDEKLREEYVQLVTGSVARSEILEILGDAPEMYADGHLVALRDMAYEVLNSPELTSIAIAPD